MELFKEPPCLLPTTLMLESLFECLIEFVRGVLRDVCVSSSDPSRGPSEYDGGHLVHTVLAKQEKLLCQVNMMARALRGLCTVRVYCVRVLWMGGRASGARQLVCIVLEVYAVRPARRIGSQSREFGFYHEESCAVV